MKRVLVFILIICFISVLQAQEKHIITSDSVALYIKVKGKGTPCLYIHGGPGSGSYWLEKFSGDFLEQHFQMIYLDQRGVGRSTSPMDNNYSMDRMIKDFEEVRESLGIKHWLTMGHSVGGILQMGYVTSKPNTIDGMIFINCTLEMDNSFGKSWLPKAVELAGQSVPAVCLDTSVSLYERMLAIMPVLNEKDIMWRLFFASEENNRKMNETYGNFSNWNIDFSEKAMEVADYWNDFRKLTPKVEQPVLFFYGKTDWAIGPDHYKGISFPNMLLWGSEVGHMPFLENKEDMEKAICSYINKYHL
ncbi:MAG: alpha/beta hydrolase [Bacteroidetes bacterium]|nr:MAG: alpha/beta hydrolase [Bacteroidota bacterium]